MSDNDWFTEPGWHDFNDPIDPGGAAAGPGAIGPVPAELISNTTSSGDWFTEPNWHDANTPIDPGGAAAGPGAIGPVPAQLISNTTPADGTPSTGAGAAAPFEVNYAELEKFAQEHDLNAEELAQWAAGDPDFPERYLATHGKVNFGTYLKIREFMASKQIAGTTFAEHNMQTSTALRASIASTKATDEANAAAFQATRMV